MVNPVLPGPTEPEGVAQFLADLARQRGVDHSAVESGFFQTPRPSSLLKRFATVEEAANMIVYVCRPLASAINRANRELDDLLRVYDATGARTHELTTTRVGDFQTQTRQLLLGIHKRSKTLKEPMARRIALNDTALSIFSRLCEGRPADAHIFVRTSGSPWNRNILSHRFQAIRERAGVRDAITIYAFRHLWTSEMLMVDVDVLLVGRMAGTSVARVERVYRHSRNQSCQDA